MQSPTYKAKLSNTDSIPYLQTSKEISEFKGRFEPANSRRKVELKKKPKP